MGRIYATTDGGRKVLLEIECDDCGVKSKPGHHDGWLVVGAYGGVGAAVNNVRLYFCPQCRDGREVPAHKQA